MKVKELPSTLSRVQVRLSLALVMVVLIISSPIVMLVNPTQVSAASAINGDNSNRIDSSGYHSTASIPAAAPASPISSPTPMMPAATNLENNGDFTTQAALSSLTARPTNNIVNTNSFYDVVFLTATSGTIKTIQVTFPAGTTIPSGAFFNEAEGIGPGTASKSGQTITYTVTNAVNVPAGTKIRLEFANINNPLNPSANYKVTVTTRDGANAIIDGPTQTAVYTIKQIGTNALANNAITTPKIADNSITLTKPNQNFMKRVSVFDNAAGHAVGWDPDGATTTFLISDPALTDPNISYVTATVLESGSIYCLAAFNNPGEIVLSCQTAPSSGAPLQYMVTNLPAHVVS